MTCYRHKKWSSIIRSWPSRDRRSLFAPFVERFDGNWDLNKTDQLFGSIWPQFVEYFSDPGKETLHRLSPFQENMHIFNTSRKFPHVFNNYFYLLSTSTTKSTEIVSHLFHVSRHVTKLTSLLISMITVPLHCFRVCLQVQPSAQSWTEIIAWIFLLSTFLDPYPVEKPAPERYPLQTPN